MSQDVMPFALVVRFTVRPGAEAQFDALVAETVAAIRDSEPETLVYACHRAVGEPGRRTFYELYRDRAAFEMHESMAHTRRFLAEREALLEATDVEFLSLVDGRAPVKVTAEFDA